MMRRRERPGYLGGNISLGEKMDLVQARLWPLPAVDLGWRFQCWCGETRYVRYRGRIYCPRCGRRPAPDGRPGGPGHLSLAEAFEAVLTGGDVDGLR